MYLNVLSIQREIRQYPPGCYLYYINHAISRKKMHDLVKRSVGFLYNKLMGNQSCTLGKIYTLIFSLFLEKQLSILPHNAVLEPSKTVPTQTLPKFHHRNDQSTILSILVEKLAAAVCCKRALFRPKNRAYFIKGTHRKNHFRANPFNYTGSRLYI